MAPTRSVARVALSKSYSSPHFFCKNPQISQDNWNTMKKQNARKFVQKTQLEMYENNENLIIYRHHSPQWKQW